MIKICESNEKLVEAYQERLTSLYAPVAANDQIDLAARYWANAPRSDDDVRLCGFEAFTFCGFEAFAFGTGDEQCPNWATVPETWAEAQITAQSLQTIYQASGLETQTKVRTKEEQERIDRIVLHHFTGLSGDFFQNFLAVCIGSLCLFLENLAMRFFR